jgi:hypothetical protein
MQRQVDPSFNPRYYINATSSTDWSSLTTRVPLLPAQHLRNNLTFAGVPDSNRNREGTRNQAHHIVEVNDLNAALARHLLSLAGIEINSAINGVFLPEYEGDDTGNATVHFGSHRIGYAEIVNQYLSTAIDSDPLLNQRGARTNILQNMLAIPPDVQNRLRIVLTTALHQLRIILLTQYLSLNNGYRVDPEWKPDKRDDNGSSGTSDGSSGSSWTRISGRLVRA